MVTVNIQHGDVIDNFDWLCIWVRTWIVSVEAVNIGHEEKIIRMNHCSSNGGEGVVVAEFYFLVTVNQPESEFLDSIFQERERTLTARVSFSFTMGMIPMFRSSEKVFTAFRY